MSSSSVRQSRSKKIDGELKMIIQGDYEGLLLIKDLTFSYLKNLVDASIALCEDKSSRGFKDPLKSISRLKYIILKRDLKPEKRSDLLIKIAYLGGLKGIPTETVDAEVKRLLSEKKVSKSPNSAKKSDSKLSAVIEANNSFHSNDEVIINRSGFHYTKKNKRRSKNRSSNKSD
jgi:hypothetical protein